MRLSIASFFAFIAAVNTVHAAAWGWPSWGRPKLGQSLPSLQSQSIQASSSAATSPTPPQTPQQQQQITNFQPFNFTVKCRNVSELACQHVHSSLGRVGQKISQQLHITQTINVYLQYEPFSIFDPNSSGAVGYAFPFIVNTPARPVAATGGDQQYYIYPQALLKQLNNTIPLNLLKFHAFDIGAKFNADQQLWFKDDLVRAALGPITPEETDFDVVLSHELAHGFGFVTSLSTHLPIVESHSYTLCNYQGTRTEWIPVPYIFDKFLRLSSSGKEDVVSNFFKPIPRSSISSRSTSSADIFRKDWEQSGQQYSSSVKLNDLIASSSCSVRFSSSSSSSNTNNSPPSSPLEACLSSKEGIFEQGSTLSHFQDDASTLPIDDWLMVPDNRGMKGKTLDTLVRESKDTHDDGLVYGGQTLQVFSNMGWRTVLNDADQSSTSIQFDEDAIKYPREIIALVPAKFTVPSNAAGTVNDGDGPQSGATVDHRRQWLLASLMLLLSLL